MAWRPFYHLAWALLLSVAFGVVAVDNACAQDLSDRASPGAEAAAQSEKLRQSLDVVISTLENGEQRQALLKQLKTLRNDIGAEGGQAANSINTPDGLLSALASAFNDDGKLKEAQDFVFGAWLSHARAARDGMRALLNDTS